jgi:hypothetical protein
VSAARECACGGEAERRGEAGEAGRRRGRRRGRWLRGEGGRRPEVGGDPDKRAPLVCERERGGREEEGRSGPRGPKADVGRGIGPGR